MVCGSSLFLFLCWINNFYRDMLIFGQSTIIVHRLRFFNFCNRDFYREKPKSVYSINFFFLFFIFCCFFCTLYSIYISCFRCAYHFTSSQDANLIPTNTHIWLWNCSYVIGIMFDRVKSDQIFIDVSRSTSSLNFISCCSIPVSNDEELKRVQFIRLCVFCGHFLCVLLISNHTNDLWSRSFSQTPSMSTW